MSEKQTGNLAEWLFPTAFLLCAGWTIWHIPAFILDFSAMPIIFFFGARKIVVAPMEFQDWRRWDRFALFIGRCTMIMIIAMTGVMLYEVFMRYVVEAPTKWANELTLWIAGFVFLCSGFYGMQQRSHIRIFILYDGNGSTDDPDHHGLGCGPVGAEPDRGLEPRTHGAHRR